MPFETWPPQKIAYLGFLVGKGDKPLAIAKDPAFKTSPNSLYRQASRYKLSFRDVEPPIEFSPKAAATFASAAGRRGMHRQELVNRIVEILGAEPTLLENVIDDGCEATA